MLKKSLLMILISVFIISNFAFSQLAMNKIPLDEKLPIDPQVKVGKLDNGLTYYIRENQKPENRAEFQIVILAGSSYEKENQLGLAHFLEHMCFNGTKNFPKDKLVSFLESTGMRFGADVNANTGFDRTYYMVTIPTDKEGMIDKGLQVIQDWLANVSFDTEEIEKERGVILEEWRLRDTPQSKAFLEHFKTFAEGSIFPKRYPIGDTAVFMNAPREAFIDYYENWYRPNLAAVIAVGDFDKSEIESKIKDMFGSIKNPANARQTQEQSIPITDKQTATEYKHPEITRTQVVFETKHPPMPDGSHGAYRNNIMHGLIGSMANNRLAEKLQEANPPYLNAFFSYSNYFVGNIATSSIYVFPKTDNILNSVEAGLAEIFRIKEHGFTESELERAKAESMRFIKSAHSEKDKTESMTYAREYFRAFYEGEGFPGIDYELRLYQTFLPEITLEEVNDAFNEYFAPENLHVSVTAPDMPSISVPTGDEFIALYNKMENGSYDTYEDVATDVPLMADKPTPGKITAERMIDNGEQGISEFTLSNGAKVYLKHTDFKNDEVIFTAYSHGGGSLYSKNEYMNAMMASEIPGSCGLGEFDAITLEKMMAGKIANVSPYINDYSEGMNGSFSPDDMETFFQLLYMSFTNPRNDKTGFDAFISRFEESIENRNNNPRSVYGDSVRAWLYDNHYFNQPVTKERLMQVSFDKAMEIYKERFSNAGDFEFVFVGNFDKNKIKPMIEQYIASLPAQGENEQWKDRNERLTTKSMNKSINKGMDDKSTVLITMNSEFDYNYDDYLDLNAMVEVLSIRLREEIREEKGGVYGIGAYERANRIPYEYYTIQISFTTEPTRVDELVSAIEKVIEEVKSGDFDDENIVKVKSILKAEFETAQKENRFWLSSMKTVFYNDIEKEYLDYYKNYENMIDEITKDEIVEAAKEFIKTQTMKKFVLYPQDFRN